MGGFLRVVTGFPTVVFSFALVVVVGYWFVVLLGGVHFHGGHHGGHQSTHGGHHHGHGGLRRTLGLGGVPITVAVSLLIALAWFSALAGTVLLDGRHGGALLPAALVGGWLGARVLVWPLRRLMPAPGPPPSRLDFVGRGCVIRTGRVGPDFGQAEVRAEDGSSAVVQVRQSADEATGPGSVLTSGASALIYDYDAEGEFFRVIPDLPALL
ncbi:hypothetical protein [Streptacidiphilus sp. PAMC 29251]